MRLVFISNYDHWWWPLNQITLLHVRMYVKLATHKLSACMLLILEWHVARIWILSFAYFVNLDLFWSKILVLLISDSCVILYGHFAAALFQNA